MAGEEKMGSGTSSDGADWEVVSLTASIYAAAPGPVGIDVPHESMGFDMSVTNESKADSKIDKVDFDPMFISKHFALSPSEFESLKVDPKHDKIDAILGKEDIQCARMERHVLSAKEILEETCKTKPDDSLDSYQYFDKEKGLTDSDTGFGVVEALKKEVLFDSSALGILNPQTESVCEGSSPHKEEKDICEPALLDPPPNSPIHSLGDSTATEENDSVSGIPNEVSWKKQTKVLFNQAKESKTFWTILVAATVVGLVILGHRRQRAKLQVKPIVYNVRIDHQSARPVWGLVNRFRGVLVNDQHNLPVNNGLKYSVVGAS